MWQCCDYYGQWYWVDQSSGGDKLIPLILVVAGIAYLAWFIQFASKPKKICNCDECRRKRGELVPLSLPQEGEWPFQ